jgi:hypothetical protein
MKLSTRTALATAVVSTVSVLVGLSTSAADAYYTPTNSPSGSTKIGTIFRLPGTSGEAAAWGSTHGCTAEYTDVDFGERLFSRVVVNGYNLDDKTSSFKDFAGCDTRFWQYSGYDGEFYGFVDGTTSGTDVPFAFDNRASSSWWS